MSEFHLVWNLDWSSFQKLTAFYVNSFNVLDLNIVSIMSKYAVACDPLLRRRGCRSAAVIDVEAGGDALVAYVRAARVVARERFRDGDLEGAAA